MYPINQNQIYLHGILMGAMGAFNLLSVCPSLFAAALLIQGIGNPCGLVKAKNIPIWNFDWQCSNETINCHNKTAIGAPYLCNAWKMEMALNEAGNTHAKFTIIPSQKAEPNLLQLFGSVYNSMQAIDWLFHQDRFSQYEITWIKPGVYQIDDYSGSTSYLVEGKEKALLIDTGWGGGDYKKIVSSLTMLPIELAVTHAHADHYAHVNEFTRVYIHKKDISLLKNSAKHFSQMRNIQEIKADILIPVVEGTKIDLGGGVVVLVIEIGGHTPGSVAYADPFHQILAIGDAIGSGSGAWMQLETSLTIEEYRESLGKFSKKVKELGKFTFLGGHRKQDGLYGTGPGHQDASDYNPPCIEMVDDMQSLCDGLLGGGTVVYPSKYSRSREQAYTSAYRTASIVYLPSKLKKKKRRKLPT